MPGSIPYSFFVEAGLKITAVLGTAWLAALFMRGRSAATRHLAWSVAFAALLALPFLSITLPALRLPAAFSRFAPGLLLQASAHGSTQEPAWKTGRYAKTAPPLKSAHWQPDCRMMLIFVWAAGAAISFAQMFIGWIAIKRLRRTATPSTMPAFPPWRSC